MKSLLFYDNTGKIFFKMDGVYSLPQGGLQCIEEEIPTGKRPISIDVSSTPHKINYEDIPKTELELLKEQVETLTEANAELTNIVAMGSTNV